MEDHAVVFPCATAIPRVGLGTWTQHKPGEVRDSVTTAIRLGYRHIDCAAEYQNEGEVGDAIKFAMKEQGLKRSELWITSKLNNPDHHPDRIEEACRESLIALGLDYLDLYLIHWPVTPHKGPTLEPPLDVTWLAMEALVGKGLVRAIGVSNFSIKKLAGIIETANIRPAVNQIEGHPYFRNDEVIAWCRDNGIHVTCYSPLGTPHTASFFKRKTPEVLKDKVVLEIADKLGKHPAQILIRWGVQRGTSVIPKSTKEPHLRNLHKLRRANLDVLGWHLPEEDYDALNELSTQCRMLDGNWYLSSEGPYRTLEDLWDRKDEKQTSIGAPGNKH